MARNPSFRGKEKQMENIFYIIRWIITSILTSTSRKIDDVPRCNVWKVLTMILLVLFIN